MLKILNMGNILLVSENNDIIEKYKNYFSEKYYTFNFCNDEIGLKNYIENNEQDIYLVDENTQISGNVVSLIKKIRNFCENSHIILCTENNEINHEISNLISGIIPDNFSQSQVLFIVNSHLKNKENFDKLYLKNKDMSNNLYRLNVLYNTSSQFAGTLDTKELLNYMTEGLDRSLSFDLTCTISFGFENEPVFIVNSLYDISEELMNALKLRAIINYKSLFENNEFPFEIDDINLKIVKNIKNHNEKFTLSIFQYDNMFAPIDLGNQFFGSIEIFRKKPFTSDDVAYFQTIVRQVSLPLKSAGLYKEIKEKNQELEQLEHIKSNFISIVSHELRTPLTPLKNALSILSSDRCGKLNTDGQHFINMAKRNVNILTNIINDILDINKIEAGKMDFNYQSMNIHSVIENVKNNFESVAKENEINLAAIENENLPNIYADSQRLEQIFTNLVSNAIKFTPQGKNITIKTELKNSSEIIINEYFENELSSLHGDYIVVSVADQGIGIKEENLLKVFDEFTQIENALTRKVGGTGLGLSIAKQLVKAHKGAIWCDSKENEGTNFYVALPVYLDNSVENQTIQKELLC